jgi:DNA-binding winged helix-turn-helix (wHTH) protein/tetratricopeptide (TPR) repeat protein
VIYRFAGFELDGERYLLTRAGAPVEIEPRAFEVLHHLLAARGRAVSKDELVEAVWDGRFVSDAAVVRAVQKARRALDDGEGPSGSIETVHGRGYRVVVPVEVVAAARAVARSEDAGVATAIEPPAATEAPRPVVVVLALRNLGPARESDWIGLALAELLAAEIAADGGARVVPAERVSELARDLPALARAGEPDRDISAAIRSLLGADFVVSGSHLSPPAGGRSLRAQVTVRELSGARPPSTVVENDADGDLAAVATRLAARLRQSIGGRVSAVEPRAWRLLPSHRESARLFTEGVALLRCGDVAAAVPVLERAAAAAPAFAPAHAALASALRELGCERQARERAATAHRLAATLPREHRLLVEGLHQECERDWAAAAESYAALARFYPDDLEYGLLAARAQVHAGALDRAAETIRALRAQPAAWQNDLRLDLTEAMVAAGRRDAHRMVELAAVAGRKAAARGARRLEAQAAFDEARGWRFLGDGPRTESCYQRAMELYQAANDRNGVAAVMQHRGATLFHQGQREQAKALIEKALDEFTTLGRPGLAARCRLNLGMLAQDRGDSATAVTLFEDALATFRDLGDSEFESQVLQALVNVRYGEGDAAACLELSRQGLAVARAAGNRRHEGEFHLRIQDAHFLAGRMTEAAAALDEALAAFRKVDYPLGEAMTYNSLGSVRNRQGDLAESARLHLDSLERFRHLGDATRSADALNRAANARYAQGQLEAARDLHRESLAGYEAIGHRFGVGVASYGLAADLLALGSPAEADSLYRAAFEIYTEIGHRSFVAEALRGLAEVQVARGDLDAARGGLERALDHLRAQPSPDTERNVRLLLARIDLEQGRAVEAEKELRRFLAAGDPPLDADSEGASRDLLAQALLDQGRAEEARVAVRRALSLTERTQRSQLRLGIEISAARVSAALGETGDATAALLAVAERARELGLISRRLEAQLVLGSVRLRAGQSAAASTTLAEVSREAAALGLSLLGERAASADPAAAGTRPRSA